MSYWNNLLESRPEGRVEHYADPPISVMASALVKKCDYFLVRMQGTLEHSSGVDSFSAETAPTESASVVQYGNGSIERRPGRVGATNISAEGIAYSDTHAFSPRTHALSPVSLIHFDCLPIWGTWRTSVLEMGGYIPTDVSIYNNRFLRLTSVPKPGLEPLDSSAELIMDLRHRVAIHYQISHAEFEPLFTSAKRAQYFPNPLGGPIEESYVE